MTTTKVNFDQKSLQNRAMRTFREKTSGNYQLKLRPNRDVENVFRAYESSLETERLESERGRQIYCELIDLGRKENLEQISENVDNKPSQITADKPVDDDDDEEEERAVGINEKPKWWTKLSVEANPPKYLGEIAIEKIAESFEKGTIDGRIVCQDAVDFGMNCDVELPILSLMELEVNFIRLIYFNFFPTHNPHNPTERNFLEALGSVED